MSKMILLELTVKEAEMVQKLVLDHSKVERNKDKEDFTDHERRVFNCGSVFGSIEKALLPQKEAAITLQDLNYIVSEAKNQYLALPAILHISNKKIEENDLKHIALVNAAIMCLNQKNLLKRSAVFEFTDHSYDYEVVND